LRRGKIITLYQEKSTNQPCGYVWKTGHGFMEWSQVAIEGKPYGQVFKKPHGVDRPFIVSGTLSDADLVAVVRFMRASPEKPDKRTENPDGSESFEPGTKVNGADPISGVIAKGDCYVEVNTEYRPGAGHKVEIVRTNTSWQIYAVSEWVM